MRFAFRYILVPLIPCVLFVSCYNVPTDTLNNENDPLASNYIPPAPLNFSSNFYNRNTRISINWTIKGDVINGVDGFVVKRSLVPLDASNQNYYAHFQTVPLDAFEDDLNFSISHSSQTGVFFYSYQIQSYFIKEADTLFSEPLISNLEKPIRISNSFAVINPFTDPPNYKIHVSGNFDTNTNINVFKRYQDDTFIELALISAHSDTTLPLDVYDEKHSLVYQLTSNNYVSSFFEFNNNQTQLDIQNSMELTSENLNSFSIKINFGENLPDDPTLVQYKSIDSIDAELVRISNSDSSMVVDTTLNVGEAFVYKNANTSNKYQFRFKVQKGNYRSFLYTLNIEYKFDEFKWGVEEF